jgi:amino acid transporter
MIRTVVVNSIFAFGFIICLLFTIGDLATVSASSTGFPIIEVYYEATKSYAGTNAMVAMLIIVETISCFSIFASTSRLLWAFARDQGFPYSYVFSYVRPEALPPPMVRPPS